MAKIVDHPIHYGGEDNVYEVIKVCEAWGLDKDAYLYNVVTYVARAGKKDKETEIEDLEKALFYLKRKIDNLKRVGGGIVSGEMKEDIIYEGEGLSEETIEKMKKELQKTMKDNDFKPGVIFDKAKSVAQDIINAETNTNHYGEQKETQGILKYVTTNKPRSYMIKTGCYTPDYCDLTCSCSDNFSCEDEGE